MRRVASLVAVLLAAALSTACVPPPTGEVAEAAAADPVDVARESVLRIRNVSACGVSIGSGFVIDGNRLVTNRHVVSGARRLEVETWDGRRVAVGDALEGVDTDLGIIELRPRAAREFEPLTLSEEPVQTGARVAAIGYALAGPAVTTRGQFLDRPRGRPFGEPDRVLRYNTTVEHGNSGGPLVNRAGDVVGVVFAYEVATGHGLAIPLERLEATLDDRQATTPVTPC
jgi:S1-C subfamily serine protease